MADRVTRIIPGNRFTPTEMLEKGGDPLLSLDYVEARVVEPSFGCRTIEGCLRGVLVQIEFI